MKSVHGTFYGVGVGPGDPELLTLKAARLIQSADVICYLVNDHGKSQAYDIARVLIEGAKKDFGQKSELLPITMPMSRDVSLGTAVYNEASIKIAEYLATGSNVVFLCEGDPLFFGSFAYLLERIQQEYKCEVVPGITSPQSASAALQLPLTMLKESYAVISGRHSDEKIRQTLSSHDTVVIMKAGSSRPRLLTLLAETNRLTDARYLEFIGRPNQLMIEDVSALIASEEGPYFSLFVVTQSKAKRVR